MNIAVSVGPRSWPVRSFAVSRATIVTFAVLLATSIALRGVFIGDPALGVDESFYLLVGDRMWQGAMPYVDIWDRKPIGLFLLYAMMRPFSSDGIVAYQIGALVFTTLTAFVITRISARFVALPAAIAGGIVYIIYLPILGGVGGQSPVFYNLFMATAALLIVKTGQNGTERRARVLAGVAMLLVGIAIQVKTSAVVEGFYFGCWLLYRRWRATRAVRGLIADTAVLIAVTMVPTALAAGFYFFKGHGDAFVYANILSVFRKHEPAGFSELRFLRQSAVEIAPILLIAVYAAARLLWRRPLRQVTAFVLIWLPFAIAGFFVIGHFYDHYALPALLPLSILCATILERGVVVGVVIGFFMSWNVVATGFPALERTSRHKARIHELTEAMAPYARLGCVYVNSGPPILYLETRSCLATRYAFPEHLSVAAEAEATGGVPAIAAVIARRPVAILVGDQRFWAHYPHPRNRDNEALLSAALASNYHLKALLEDPDVIGHLQLFVRNDLR